MTHNANIIKKQIKTAPLKHITQMKQINALEFCTATDSSEATRGSKSTFQVGSAYSDQRRELGERVPLRVALHFYSVCGWNLYHRSEYTERILIHAFIHHVSDSNYNVHFLK